MREIERSREGGNHILSLSACALWCLYLYIYRMIVNWRGKKGQGWRLIITPIQHRRSIWYGFHTGREGTECTIPCAFWSLLSVILEKRKQNAFSYTISPCLCLSRYITSDASLSHCACPCSHNSFISLVYTSMSLLYSTILYKQITIQIIFIIQSIVIICISCSSSLPCLITVVPILFFFIIFDEPIIRSVRLSSLRAIASPGRMYSVFIVVFVLVVLVVASIMMIFVNSLCSVKPVRIHIHRLTQRVDRSLELLSTDLTV